MSKMSNNYDKIVKLACKPKNAPPKSKYVDVLISATYSEDGSLNDVIRHLSLRLREPNAVVVFKALLTLHQMIRSGSTDQLLEQLSRGDMLRLRNLTGQHWEGYSPPVNMGSYAQYLDSRIRVWRDLKHDLVRVQTESNRRSDGLGAGSKARRLRHLSVEKGLLREVKGVQRILDSLIQCRFYDDDLHDENTVLAFRMLIKDLLVLFQAGNEGVCNILEHYFEMSKSDATEAFDIYKYFIKQTDKVVDYLGVARKLHNVVNVPVPNLKHAPTGLVKALEEYLNDPNFEDNRREYRASLGVVEGRPAGRTPSPAAPSSSAAKTQSSPPKAGNASPPKPSSPAPFVPPPNANQKIQDFFDSIATDSQPTMFGGPPQPFPQQTQMQMQAPFNPFRQSMMPQMTGFGQPQQGQFSGPFLQPQMTGQMAFGNRQSMFPPNNGPSPFMQPQQTGFIQPQPQIQQNSPFLQPQSQQQQQQNMFQQPQPLQPHQTGPNPFRQSTMLLGNNSSHPSGILSQPTSPAGAQHQITRPGSTPAVGQSKPLAPQPTGKNPFAPAGGVQNGSTGPTRSNTAGPSMNELAFNKAQSQFGVLNAQQTGAANPWMSLNGKPSTGVNTQNTGASPWGTFNGKPSSPINGSTNISDIASSFAVDSSKPSSTSDFLSQFGSLSVNTNTTAGGSQTSPSVSQFGSTSSNPTGSTSPTKSAGGFMQPQQTGFGGSNVKRFQPTSSFGSSLVESLPPITEPQSPGTGSGTPGSASGVQPQSTGFPGFNPSNLSGPSSTPFGQAGQGGGGLQPQGTGMPNPFRQSTFGMGPNPTGNAGGIGVSTTGAFGPGSPFAGQNKPTGQNGMGSGAGAGAFGTQPFSPSSAFGSSMQFGQNQPQAPNNQGQNQQPQAGGNQPFGSFQQRQAGGSLI